MLDNLSKRWNSDYKFNLIPAYTGIWFKKNVINKIPGIKNLVPYGLDEGH